MTLQGKSSLHFVTWNTCGIKDTCKSHEKISSLLKILNDLQADIVFLQETHIGPQCYKILEHGTGIDCKVYFTVHSSRSKGVAILIRKTLQFEYICHDEDCSGGYIVLFCHLYGELYTLVNVYNHKTDRNILPILKDYLMETAEGVLVVGGDFNTVLHPSFDRKPSNSRHSQFRAILEDFTASLNLTDTWAYKHSTEEVFTRHQNESHSRLDMFFLQEINLSQVHHNRVEQQPISDHHPLVLELRVHKRPERKIKQHESKIPYIARKLRKLRKLMISPDRRSGKISGAEILSVIKSLPNSKNEKYYKRNRCPLTETLKSEFNFMIKNKKLPEQFKKDKSTFNLNRLILCKILSKRLNAFTTPSFKGKTATKLDNIFTVTFKKVPQNIKWSYLKKIIDKTKQICSAPSVDFSILEFLLPKAQNSSGYTDFKLSPKSPLTTPILNLALKDLTRMDYNYEWKCEEAGHLSGKCHKPKCKEIKPMFSVCYQRKVLLIHTQSEISREVSDQLDNFKEMSGLKINITKT